MSLLAMLKRGGLRQLATAIPATFATDAPLALPKVARVATVAVANPQTTAANDPAPTTKVQASLSAIADVKGLPTTLADGAVIDVGTIRPPGLSPALLAASLALDAQIHTAGHFGNSDENPDADLDRWCYPATTAMTGGEIGTFMARLARFTDKGVIHADAESIADKLVIRDRDGDDRRLCLECTHLGGYGSSSWRCGNWQAAGVAHRAQDSKLPVDLVMQLQRCDGMVDAI